MKNTLELRIIELAQRIADMYIDDLDAEKYQELCHAIHVCREYAENNIGNWGDLYEVVEGDGGIWEYAALQDMPEKLAEMYTIENCVLSCMCYIACRKDGECTPEDMELREENIPGFIEFVEKNFYKNSGYRECTDFWGDKVCY